MVFTSLSVFRKEKRILCILNTVQILFISKVKFIDRSSGKVPGSKPDKHPSSMEIGATSSPCATGGVAVVGDFFDLGGGVCHDFHLLCSVEVIAVIWFLDRGVKPQLPNRSSRHRSDDTSLRFYTGFISRNDEL